MNSGEELYCEICGKPLQRRSTRGKKPKYCSYECQSEARRRRNKEKKQEYNEYQRSYQRDHNKEKRREYQRHLRITERDAFNEYHRTDMSKRVKQKYTQTKLQRLRVGRDLPQSQVLEETLGTFLGDVRSKDEAEDWEAYHRYLQEKFLSKIK